MNFINNLELIRQEMGLSMVDFSTLVGIKSNIYWHLTQYYSISDKRQKAIADKIGIPLEILQEQTTVDNATLKSYLQKLFSN